MENLTDVLKPAAGILLAHKQLKEKDLIPADKPISLPAARSWPIPLQDCTFSLGVNALVEVSVYNDGADTDPEGLLTTRPEGELVYDPAKNAYLKYSAAIGASANGSTSLEKLGFTADLSATGNAKAIWYSKHAPEQAVREAFRQDVEHFKTIFKWEDVAGLQAGEAVSFFVNGSVRCGLKVSWSNIFSQSLQALAGVLPVPLSLDLDLTPSLTVDFDIAVGGSFIYNVTRQADGRYSVSVNKTRSKSVSGGAGATIGVAFSKPDEVTGQINAIYARIVQSLLGHPLEQINEAIEKVKQGVATEAQKPIVSKLLELFKVKDATAPVDALQQKLATLSQQVPADIEKIAKANVSLSFEFTYKRIEENRELLSGVLGAGDLKDFHNDLLRFNTVKLLEGIRSKQVAFDLKAYMQQRTLTIERSWGFGLRLFDKTLLLGQDYSEEKIVVNTNIDAQQQVAIDYMAGYKWQMGKAHGSWMGEWAATMPGFSGSKEARLDELDLGLQLNMILSDPATDIKDLRKYMDMGVLWGAILQKDVDALTAKYIGALDKKEVLAETRLVIPAAVMRVLVQRIGANGWNDLNRDYLTRSMGAAMSYLEEFPLRREPRLRERTYAGLWQAYLDDPGQDQAALAAMAADTIGNLPDEANLGAFEGQAANTVSVDFYASLIRQSAHLEKALQDFINGVVKLQKAIQEGASYTGFDGLYTDLAALLGDSFFIRTMGYFLLLHAADANLSGNINAIFTITAGTGDATRVINFSVV